MTHFIQLHMLTAYGPSAMNRDDSGRPKTVNMGGALRLRLSSQSLKRAWRDSAIFAEGLRGHLGYRTRQLGQYIHEHLIAGGMDADKALDGATRIAGVFGKPAKEDADKPAHIEQMAFISPAERQSAFELADQLLAGQDIAPKAHEIMQHTDTAADIAMFGRMMAADQEYSRDAAVQVSQAVTTHRADVEEDYYTALDDLRKDGAAAAGFISSQQFGTGVFYCYICINRDLLLHNVDDNQAVCDAALAALIQTAATVSPGGKQNSFANNAYASYIMAEKGQSQPRTLVSAFDHAVDGSDRVPASIAVLESCCEQMDTSYPLYVNDRHVMNVLKKEGNLQDLIQFAVN